MLDFALWTSGIEFRDLNYGFLCLALFFALSFFLLGKERLGREVVIRDWERFYGVSVLLLHREQ